MHSHSCKEILFILLNANKRADTFFYLTHPALIPKNRLALICVWSNKSQSMKKGDIKLSPLLCTKKKRKNEVTCDM